MYVATLTADEIVYAGGVLEYSDFDCYLINDYQKRDGYAFWWSLSPYSSSRVFGIFYSGYRKQTIVIGGISNCDPLSLDNTGQSVNYYSRSSIQLLSSVQISSGDGTQQNPYIVK